MALPTPLTSAEAGGSCDFTEVRAQFNVGPQAGHTLLVDRLDPNLEASVRDGSVTLEDPGPYLEATPPVNVVPPTISGTPQVGQMLVLDPGLWIGNPTLTRQWFRSGTMIGTATGLNYLLVAEDEADMISCEVTATNVDGSVQLMTAELGPILAAAVMTTTNPAPPADRN